MLCRGTCIDTWSGEWVYRSWEKKYDCFGIVDPFISTDNCARTIPRGRTGKLARSFKEAAEHLTQAGQQGSYSSKSDDVPMVASLFHVKHSSLFKVKRRRRADPYSTTSHYQIL